MESEARLLVSFLTPPRSYEKLYFNISTVASYSSARNKIK